MAQTLHNLHLKWRTFDCYWSRFFQCIQIKIPDGLERFCILGHTLMDWQKYRRCSFTAHVLFSLIIRRNVLRQCFNNGTPIKSANLAKFSIALLTTDFQSCGSCWKSGFEPFGVRRSCAECVKQTISTCADKLYGAVCSLAFRISPLEKQERQQRS